MTFLKIKSQNFKRYGISFYKISDHIFADVNLGLTTWMVSLWQSGLLEEPPIDTTLPVIWIFTQYLFPTLTKKDLSSRFNGYQKLLETQYTSQVKQ